LTAEKFVLALYAGNWAYGGYDTLNYGAEEVRNYRRQVIKRKMEKLMT
jgi:hypothetical protein